MVLDANDLENDGELIEACRRGDSDAFTALFEAHKDRVYSIALRFSGDRAAAMDIAQDVFLKLLSSIKDFREEARFESWLYRLVVNCCLDHQRRRRRWLPLLDQVLGALRVSGPTALQEIMGAEARESIQQMVAGLSPEQRIVIVLRYTEGLSYDEIAEIAGCSAGTVASRLNRAHRILERRLSHLRLGRGAGRGGWYA